MATSAAIIATTCAATCAAAYAAILLAKAILAVRYAARYPRPHPQPDLAAATIVQPILGGDPDLHACLSDNLATLPEARFLWLIDEDDEEAAAITLKLRDAHPAHRIERRVCPAPPPEGVNPKLFKLELARSEVTDGAFVVVDDDTRVTRDGLAALLAALHTHTMATGLPT